MRLVRISSAAAVSFACALLTTQPAVAQAATAPTSPYTAVVVDGANTYWPTLVVAPSDATIDLTTLSPAPGYASAGISMLATTNDHAHWFQAQITAPTGTTLSEGTFSTLRFSDASHAGLDLTMDSNGCGQGSSGTITISDLTWDATGRVNSIAVGYSISSVYSFCEQISGELRWHSSVDYKAVTTSVKALAFGSLPLNTDGTAQVVTVTGAGSKPTTFGTAAIVGVGSSSFTISRDTCSSTSLSYGDTCTVTVLPHGTTPGEQQATLTIPDDTFTGSRQIALSVTGVDQHQVSLSTPDIAFGYDSKGGSSAPRSVTITSTGPSDETFAASTIGGDAPAAYSVSSDTCAGKTLHTGDSCTVSVVAHPISYTTQNATLYIHDNSFNGVRTVPLTVIAIPGGAGAFYSLIPARLLDTRTTLGGHHGALGPGAVAHLQIAGRASMPPTGIGAVVLNVTVTAPTASSYLTIYPSGTTRPAASNLNFQQGGLRSNSVTVKVGSNGQIDIFNFAGSTQVIVDVAGFYAADDSAMIYGGYGGQLHPVAPFRMIDSRDGGGSPMPGGYYATIGLTFPSGVSGHVRAFAVNVTAVNASSDGFITAWNGDSNLPSTSTVNFKAHQVVPNFAIIQPGMCPRCGFPDGTLSIGIYSSATTHFLVDMVGYYDDGLLSGGLRFHPISPTRITDSRMGLGTANAIGADSTATITTPASIAGAQTVALALNVTAVAPTQSTYLTLYPTGITRPTASNLNPTANEVVPNAAITLLNSKDQFTIYNRSGTCNVVIDVAGTFEPGIDPDTPTAAGAATTPSARSPIGLTPEPLRLTVHTSRFRPV